VVDVEIDLEATEEAVDAVAEDLMAVEVVTVEITLAEDIVAIQVVMTVDDTKDEVKVDINDDQEADKVDINDDLLDLVVMTDLIIVHLPLKEADINQIVATQAEDIVATQVVMTVDDSKDEVKVDINEDQEADKVVVLVDLNQEAAELHVELDVINDTDIVTTEKQQHVKVIMVLHQAKNLMLCSNQDRNIIRI